jgi:hypothetical protein
VLCALLSSTVDIYTAHATPLSLPSEHAGRGFCREDWVREYVALRRILRTHIPSHRVSGLCNIALQDPFNTLLVHGNVVDAYSQVKGKMAPAQGLMTRS